MSHPDASLYVAMRVLRYAAAPLPRNPNGKIDRKTLSTEWIEKKNAA
jgi:hypothetical protein